MSIMLPLVIALFVFAYHYQRNGNPLSIGEFFSRCFWSGSFAVGYVSLAGLHANLWLALLYGLLAFIANMVPHAFAQQMGRETAPWSLLALSKRWPAAWLPSVTQAVWDGYSLAKKIRRDCYAMLSVGVVRGAAVFLPGVYLGEHLLPAVVAAVVTAVMQPLAYLLGYITPFSMWGNSPRSSEWGEFYIGIGWALALYMALHA